MLLDELEKLKAEIKEAEAAEDNEQKQPELEETEQESLPESEETEEKETEAPVKEEKEKLDDAGYARLRREAAAEKKRADKLEREIAELQNAKNKETEELFEEKAPINNELQSMLQEHRVSKAEREFSMFESKVRNQYPEYDAISSEYASAMYNSMKIQNPRKSELELGEMTKNAILMRAAELARNGYENPVEELFHEVKELGFTGKSITKAIQKEEKISPDLRVVAENRKRSANFTASNGRSESNLTLAAASDLPISEWAKLSKSEKQRILQGR